MQFRTPAVPTRRRARVTFLCVAAAVGALLLPTGTAAGATPPAVGAATRTAGGPATGSAAQATDPTTTPVAALAQLQRLRDLTEQHADQYAGLSIHGFDRVTVHLSGNATAPGLDASAVMADAANAGLRVSFDHRTYSLARLARIQDAIPVTEPFASLGGNLVRWGVDPDSNTVLVAVTKITPALLAKARSKFGDAVSVVTSPLATAAAGRFSDVPAFYAGDQISAGGGFCSSGFTLTNVNGTRYAITAGHCWSTGTHVSTNGQSFGSVDFRRNGNNNYDNELIGGASYAGRMWIGSVNTSTSYPVRSSANSCTGCRVYFNGSVTGQSLATLSGSPFCGTIDSGGSAYTACGLQEAVGSSQICAHGDSGGPVFAYDGNGGAIAVGIITAIVTGTDCWYTQLPPILSYWQSTITTD